MFQILNEDYKTAKDALSEIFRKIESVSEIIIETKKGTTMQREKFPVEIFAGGDMKSACILYGINASNSHQPCIYCKWNKTAILDYDAEWPITRTIQEACDKIGSDGQKHNPLVLIEFDHYIIDLLHLFLRYLINFML
jgi:hypothetical protein